ncbi:hypothetical protein SXCC_01704 [Gluconacetobacter sp. SXCC-1]|nr:hypothetical protein SXCC_01704 [Gluconacetobacter sp. SXCC-1]
MTGPLWGPVMAASKKARFVPGFFIMGRPLRGLGRQRPA